MAKRGITFTFHSPDAKSVHLAGNFNGWNTSSHPLSRVDTGEGDGMWKRVFYLEPGVYEYRFVVDGIWDNGTGSVEGWTNEFGSFTCVLWI